MLSVGDLAPDFTLTDEQGRPVTLSNYRGKQPVVLVFYPGDGTPLCSAQLCEFRDSYAELQSAGAEVFGINPFGAASHRRFVTSRALPFHLLVDHGSRVALSYEARLGWSWLSMINRCVYVVGTDGRILYAAPGKPPPQEILGIIAGSPEGDATKSQ